MARPVRVEFENAVYHVSARGNERKDVFRDVDRERFLETVEEASERGLWSRTPSAWKKVRGDVRQKCYRSGEVIG